MALGCGVHVVPDADGLFEETLHAAEVDTAIDKVLHGTETGGGDPVSGSRPDQWIPTLAQWFVQLLGDSTGLPEGSLCA